MKINLNLNLKGLDGKEAGAETKQEINLGKLVAGLLISAPAKGIADSYQTKHMEWAQTLFAGKEIILDKADTAYLKKFIETSDRLTVLMVGRIKEQLEKAKP